MRHMSFALTTAQFRAGSKTVTRRLGWSGLAPGTITMGCVKCMGLGKGGAIERIHPFEVISNEPEPLQRMLEDPAYGRLEAQLEGFPEMGGAEFVEMFCQHMRVNPQRQVNRIQFQHIYPHEWITNALAGRTTAFRDEIQLHEQIAAAFDHHSIPYRREVKTVDGRIDFEVLGHVAVEVKVKGSGVAVARQVARYLEEPHIDQAVIIAANPMTLPLESYESSDGRIKPIHFVPIWNNAL